MTAQASQKQFWVVEKQKNTRHIVIPGSNYEWMYVVRFCMRYICTTLGLKSLRRSSLCNKAHELFWRVANPIFLGCISIIIVSSYLQTIYSFNFKKCFMFWVFLIGFYATCNHDVDELCQSGECNYLVISAMLLWKNRPERFEMLQQAANNII